MQSSSTIASPMPAVYSISDTPLAPSVVTPASFTDTHMVVPPLAIPSQVVSDLQPSPIPTGQRWLPARPASLQLPERVAALQFEHRKQTIPFGDSSRPLSNPAERHQELVVSSFFADKQRRSLIISLLM